MNVSTRETELFARVLATFRGERVPLDDQGAKGLWFALDQPASDLVVTPEVFVIRPAKRHDMEFSLECAPGILSFLLERVGTVGPRSIKTWIAPTTVKAGVAGGPGAGAAGGFPAFMSPPRHVLAEAWTTRVMVRIRADEAELDDELPTLAERRFVRFGHPCPHCREVPDRYRVLSDGGLVCTKCGASSAMPTT